MAKVREYEFTTGIETSTVPDPGSPSGDFDTVTLGYLNDQSYWAQPVDAYADLRALDTTMRVHNQRRVVDATEETWYFDENSTATDDGATILEPDDSPVSGRWLIESGAGGGGGGGGSSGIEALLQKLELEKRLIISEDLQNSVGIGLPGLRPQGTFEANFLKNFTTPGTSVDVVWNALAVNASDKNYDSATGWTGTGQATNVGTTTTAGQFTVGTAAIKFDKAGSGTEAAVRYDQSAQTFNVSANTRVWVYVYLPSVTNLTNVLLRIYADSTSNFRTFTVTTQFDTSAFAVGLNLLKFDISIGGTASGSGWVSTQLSRYQEIGVTTSTSGQTYTGVAFDALYFSYYAPESIGVIGNEFTLFDNSNKFDAIVSSANTLHDGRLTLTADPGNNYAGGLSGTSRARVKRSTVSLSTSEVQMDNDATFSGAVTTTQELRLGAYSRGSMAGDLDLAVDMEAVQFYKITAVGGSTVDVADTADTHLNLLSGDTMDIFRPRYIGAKVYYLYLASRALTANSSASGGTTTLTLTTTSLAVGDYVLKRQLSQVASSVVSASSNESFAAQTLLTSPDGIEVIGTGLNYPQESNIWAHWRLGGASTTIGATNLKGVGPNLTPNGSVTANGRITNYGQPSATGFTGSNFYSLTGAQSEPISGDSADVTRLQASMWFYFSGTEAASRYLFGKDDLTDNATGWILRVNNNSSNLRLDNAGNTSNIVTSGIVVGWNHVFLYLEDNVKCYFYINGVKSSNGSATNNVDNGNTFYVGYTAGSVSLNMADLIIWRNATEFSTNDVLALYNGGIGLNIGGGPIVRYRYTVTGQTGEKISMKAKVTRSTTAITPIIRKAGGILI